jgi:peptidoglycan/LPS O-acetylase OafA/YrhL
MNYFRFAVPFFVALSGLSLARKYRHQEIKVIEFFRKRVVKLLPQYLFWVAIIYLIVHLVPGWAGFVDSFPFWQTVILGRGEYHLYFVPMIISLYLLFPSLFWLTKKLGLIILLAGLLVQIWFYWYLGNVVIHDSTIKSLQTDQQQYVFFLSWIFYFILGIYLGLNDWVKNLWLGVFALPFFALGLRVTVSETKNLLNLGYNIIFASGFTRMTVILLSTSGLIAGLAIFPRVLKSAQKYFEPVIFLGRNSFLIYLSHTIVLRFLWATFYQSKPMGDLVFPAILWGVAIFISIRSDLVTKEILLLFSKAKEGRKR